MKKDLAAMDGTAVSNAKDSHLSSSSCSVQASYPKLAARPATPDLGRRKSRASVFNFSVGATPQPPQPQPSRDGEAEGGDAESAVTLARLGQAEVVLGQGGGEEATRRSEATTAEGGEKAVVAATVAAAAAAAAAVGGGGGGDSAPAQRKGSIGTRVRKMSREVIEVIGFGGGAEPPPRGAPQSLPAIEALRRSGGGGGGGGGGGALEAMGLTLGAGCAAPDHVGTENPQKGSQDAVVPAGASDSKPNPWARVRSRCGPSSPPTRRLSHAEQYIEEVTSEAVVPPHVREGSGPWPRAASPRHPRPGRCH